MCDWHIGHSITVCDFIVLYEHEVSQFLVVVMMLALVMAVGVLIEVVR